MYIQPNSDLINKNVLQGFYDHSKKKKIRILDIWVISLETHKIKGTI